MPTRKFTISLPQDVDELVRLAAAAAGVPVSTWLAQAARRVAAEEATLADGRAAIAEYVAEHGPLRPSAEDRAWVARVLADAGIGAVDQRAAS